MTDAFSRSFLLMFVLLNPFIMSVYLLELIHGLKLGALARQLFRACLISLVVFTGFAWAGDAFFEKVLQVRLSSFLIFGGITFLIVGIRLILGVGPPVETLRPESEHVSAAIAMPFMVGPGTISASVLAGSRLPIPSAILAIALALAATTLALLVMKLILDYVRLRDERMVQRYSEIAGRATALFVGSFAVEMIFNGVDHWLEVFEQSRSR